MKTIATLLLALCSIYPAFARLGETQGQIEARYGPGKQIRTRLPGTLQFEYSSAAYQIHVVFHAGRSVWELFKRKDQKITDEDIKSLLKAISPKDKWTFSRDDRVWRRDGRRYIARRAPGHDDWFSIRDERLLAPLEQTKKPDVSRF